MSYSTPQIIMERIKSATKQSPIAVFLCDKPGYPGCLKAVFGDTIESRRQIDSDDGLVGVYDNSMDMERIHIELRMSIALE